ncbi:hypothetical protein, partial [Escherichia coli]|uniref:hypothetical protein n=1 Tax=Escherichia coli TaxID=562 RepID=UPI001F1730E3
LARAFDGAGKELTWRVGRFEWCRLAIAQFTIDAAGGTPGATGQRRFFGCGIVLRRGLRQRVGIGFSGRLR